MDDSDIEKSPVNVKDPAEMQERLAKAAQAGQAKIARGEAKPTAEPSQDFCYDHEEEKVRDPKTGRMHCLNCKNGVGGFR